MAHNNDARTDIGSRGGENDACGNGVESSDVGAGGGGGRKLNIVVEGCCHGELPCIYASVLQMQERQGVKVDLLICCGDFECLRNSQDLRGLNCPDKYKRLGTFHKYYSGELVAPVLTIFIGGNHEASSYLQELHYGGWVAPKIYFMGFAGVIRVGGVRIAGLTGIYNRRHYRDSRHERPPYSEDSVRSVYHVRELEIFKLAQMLANPVCGNHLKKMLANPGLCVFSSMLDRALRPKKALQLRATERYGCILTADNYEDYSQSLIYNLPPRRCKKDLTGHVDLCLSHDWPRGIARHGNLKALFRRKSFLQKEVEDNSLGSPAAEQLLHKIQPDFWFSAHLHVKFAAVVRDFLQLVSVPRPDGEGGEGEEVLVEYDVEWLSIVKATHHLLSNARGQRVNLPFETPRVERADFDAVRVALAARGLPGGPLVISDKFQMTAPPEPQLNPQERGRALKLLPNPQTDELLSLLGLDHVVTVPSSAWEPRHRVDNPGAFSVISSSASAMAEEPRFDENTGYPFEVDLVGGRQDPNEIELDD